MKTIKFKTIVYDLVNTINVDATRLQATINKGNNTFDSIISDVTGAEEIVVYEDGSVIGTYNGYTEMIAISLHPNNTISVELINTDTESQINSLSSKVTDLEGDQATTEGAIIGIEESNVAQDLAIEDLAEAVSILFGGE